MTKIQSEYMTVHACSSFMVSFTSIPLSLSFSISSTEVQLLMLHVSWVREVKMPSYGTTLPQQQQTLAFLLEAR